jgi:hypothetical protein
VIRRTIAMLTSVLLGLGLILTVVTPAHAAPRGWADFSFTGSANNHAGTMNQQPTGFPEADYVSDSASGSAVGRQSGASTFLPASTEVGQRYGSSQGRPT